MGRILYIEIKVEFVWMRTEFYGINFVLNQEPFRNARILVGNTNFGCGSSREGAVYTLLDFGFRVLVAPSFGDIFAANCLKNGLLTIQLPGDTVAALRDEVRTARPPVMSVDLAAQRITRPNGSTLAFSIEPFHKQCLLEGLNEIDLALQHGDVLADFDRRYRDRFPWLFAAKAEGR